MNTNHNRIRVSDLETDERDKILATNSKGELEFIATKNIKVDSYNALDYDQEGKALDARQGKILKDLVNNKTDKGGFQGTTQDLANSIPDLNSANLKLGSYPSTRNDGQLSTNKVLSTDASGNLKLYSLPISSIYPAPYLTEILPYNFLPNTTGNIILKGSFFTPTMTVVIQGQTVNKIDFKSDNEVHVNVTTESAEGNFSVTLDNGISRVFPNALLVVLGEVFIPIERDFTIVTGNPNIAVPGEFKLNLFNIACSADFFEIPVGQNFRVYVTPTPTPLSSGPISIGPDVDIISLLATNDSSVKFKVSAYLNGVGRDNPIYAYQSSTGLFHPNNRGQIIKSTIIDEPTFYFERIGTEFRVRNWNQTILFTDTYSGNLKIRVNALAFDLKNLKYVKLL